MKSPGDIPLEGDANETQSVRVLAEFWRLVDATWTPSERVAMSYLLTDGGRDDVGGSVG